MSDEPETDPMRDHNASPINALPGIVWLLILLVAGVEIVLSAAAFGLVGGADGIGWRIRAIERFAYSSAIQQWMLENWRFPLNHLWRYLTFGYVHGSALHAVFGVVLLAALGKMVGERFSVVGFVALVLAVPVGAAVIFGLLMGNDKLGWLIGSMPLAFTLVGAFTWLRFRDAQGDREKQKRAFGLIAVLLLARLAFGLIAETGPAWIAEVAAFVLGYGVSALFFGPGSWHRLRERIRG